MKVSDYIAKFLAKEGINEVFGVTGGAIIHTFDSIGKRKDIKYICTQHEQAAAMAADGYSRVSKNIGVTIVTSGPGATNILTGICCSYYDSIPVLNITGQVSTSRLRKNEKIRQIGFQETPIVEMCKPITKYAVRITDASKIRYELEKAIYIAKTERPGPVLLDIPDDIQRAEINPEECSSYIPEKSEIAYNKLKSKIEECKILIENAKRPIIILGAGIKLGKCENEAINFIKRLKFPVNLTWATKDMLLRDDELNAGVFGVASSRCGNFAVQNSDLILAIGTRMDQHHTGTPSNTFSRESKKILVDIDINEIKKFEDLSLKWDIAINSNAKDFFDFMNYEFNTKDISKWINQIKKWKKDYSCYKNISSGKDWINPYLFSERLSKETSEREIIVVDTGATLTEIMNGYEIYKKQRIFSDLNHTSMGYALPASIGACFANDKKQVICIIGDGGFQMNIQELATIKYHKLPIKIFIFDNGGYGMIKQTQDDWLNSNYEASSIEKGIAIPNFVEIGRAYELRSEEIKNEEDLKKLKEILEYNGPVLCNVKISPDQRISPMLKVGRPIEDQKPLLPREEFLKQMIVKPLENSLKE